MPVFRRYLGALIETSMPTFALALHIENMGPVQALGFVVPLTYFIFIILSTLRLDFWLSTFTGFVAAAELFAHGDVLSSRRQHRSARRIIWYHAARSLIILICGMLAGAVGVQLRRQFAASIRGRHRARPRHQPVRPARLAAGGRAADGRGRRRRTAKSATSR